MDSTNATNVRMGLIRKKEDWTTEAFQSYWLRSHGPLVPKAPNLRGYWQNHVTDRQQRGIEFPRGPWNFDGFSQLWFDDVEKSQEVFNTGELANAFIVDENHFIGQLHIVTTRQSEVVPVPAPARRAELLKRISTLKRRNDITEEDFRREWKVHGDLVRQMPGVSGYRQNVVLERELVKAQKCGYDDLPIDGIVELWFETPATLEAAFSSPQGRRTMDHAKTFLSEITAFLVNEHRIV